MSTEDMHSTKQQVQTIYIQQDNKYKRHTFDKTITSTKYIYSTRQGKNTYI